MIKILFDSYVSFYNGPISRLPINQGLGLGAALALTIAAAILAFAHAHVWLDTRLEGPK